MSKKLTLAQAKKKLSIYDEKVKVQLDDDFHVNVNVHFSKSKLRKMFIEAMNDLNKAREKGLNIEEISVLDWILLHAIKYFTDADVPIEIKLKIQAFNVLFDTGYYSSIVESFSEENMKDIEEMIKNFNAGVNLLTEQGLLNDNELSGEETLNESSESMKSE